MQGLKVDIKRTKEYQINNPEVVLNLWAYSDEDGNVMRLAGRGYVMDGDDSSKLKLLKQLSCTDFLSVGWYPVPQNFKLVDSSGDEMNGVASAAQVSDPNVSGILFKQVMDLIAGALPEQMNSVGEGYQRSKLELPESPLCITTILIEKDDGRIVPMIST